MKKKVLFYLTFVLISFISCNTTEPPVDKAELLLELEDVSCTEAWITLTTNNLQLPATLELKQDNQIRSVINLIKPDTLLYIDSLLSNQTYKFHSTIQSFNHSSNELSVTTLDTTSHNFTFQTWTFGEHSSSVLYDAAIINENSIYAVGEIYMNDSLGQPDPHPYGIVHWNGSEWNVKRITAQNPSGGYSYIIPTGIYVLSPTEIWLARGGVYLFNGDSITQAYWLVNYSGYNGGIFNNGESASKLWGTSSEDLYTVGLKGALAHFDGISWQRIESGTELDIYDILGEYNETNNEYEIIAVAAKIGVNFEKRILRINNSGEVTSLPIDGIPYSLHGIWFKGKNYFVVGSGMYKKYDINSSTNWTAIHQGISNYYIETIRGNDLNDIIASGAFGELLHFNGISWKSYIDITSVNGSIGGNIKGNIICCYGLNNSQAIVIIGRR